MGKRFKYTKGEFLLVIIPGTRLCPVLNSQQMKILSDLLHNTYIKAGSYRGSKALC